MFARFMPFPYWRRRAGLPLPTPLMEFMNARYGGLDEETRRKILEAKKRGEYDATLQRIHRELKEQIDAIRESTRITADDLAIVINARADDIEPGP